MEVLLCLARAAWLWGSINEVRIRIETECSLDMYCEYSVDIKVHNTAHAQALYAVLGREGSVTSSVRPSHLLLLSLSLPHDE